MRRILIALSLLTVTACGTAGDTSTTAKAAALTSNNPKECKPGFGDCDAAPANGCETNLKSGNNCGACGVRCSENFATSECELDTFGAYACVVTACAEGHADCDGDPMNGCEADLNTSASACGACGNVCSVPNGVAACTLGVCGLAYCDPGYTLYGGACMALVQPCTVPNGTGEQAFDAATGTYGACVPTACDAGYQLKDGACVSQYGDWMTDLPCQFTGISPECVEGDPGYHYRGEFNGYQCWWHTKNQAWQTTTDTNIYSLAMHFGLDPTTGISAWCETFAEEPNPPNEECAYLGGCWGNGPNYNDPSQIGAWGYCAELGPGLGGWICLK